MKIRDLFTISFKNTFRNMRNTALSVCAISIGIAAVILITGLGSSTKLYTQEKIADLGVDGLSLRVDDGIPMLDPGLSYELEQQFDDVDSCLPFVYDIANALLCKRSSTVMSWGVGENLSRVIGLDVLHGRDISESDIISNCRVAVVDEKLALEHYGRSNIVGKEIRLQINGRNEFFEIIGVIQSQSQGFSSLIGGNLDSFVYIPYSVQNEMNTVSDVKQIAIRCRDGVDHVQLCDQIQTYMETAYPIDGTYYVENISSYIDQVEGILDAIVLLVTAIAAISLVVAGIGVINGMIAGISQRRREIGLYMSVGALSRDIVCDIIIETMLICLVGGFLGIVFGEILVFLVSKILGISCVIEFYYAMIALGTCVICSILFGLIPGLKAASIEPIDALKTID